MKVLLLGVTGHLGSALARELCRRGYPVSGVTRSETLPPNLSGVPLETIVGDDREPGAFDRWVRGHETVIDAGAPYGPADPNGPDAADQFGRLRDSPHRARRLLRAVRAHGSAMAYVGSFVTLAKGSRARLERRLHPYFEAKLAIEREVRDATDRGVPAVTLAPTACLGPWDYHRRRTGPIPLLLRGGLSFSPNQFVNVVDVRDVARATVSAIENELWGETLLVSGHNATLDTIVARVSELAGVPGPRFSVPASVTMAGALALRAGSGVFGRASAQWLLGALLLRASTACPTGDRQREMGIYPRPLSQTLADAVDWYRELGPHDGVSGLHRFEGLRGSLRRRGSGGLGP